MDERFRYGILIDEMDMIDEVDLGDVRSFDWNFQSGDDSFTLTSLLRET
jgi:hypothetical protein